MSTRSLIGRENADGTVSYIYCHYDGYLSGVGTTLLAHWVDPAKVDELIALGDLSALGASIGEKHPFDRWALPEEEREKVKGWCLAYGRDREENDAAARTIHSAKAYGMVQGVQVHYLLRADGIWHVQARRFEWRPLADVIADND
ncbi:hypothetical protein WV31_10175 [Magnetospirillum sp. ME-1]|uniref:hypothetical protein n=1 Tax=Magnetospirillum sp. ME-1 TaxID=1639348 RepID=UPI000A17DE00|nr:hypothetical protein [Magnetospirillum sp. ME-1]ARJ65993.1 hypothetical protein WV31_10175 [Magnetospirillum sp. ME-1]